MKRSFKIAAVLMTALMAFCLTGCVSISDTYSNADKYSAGNAEFKGSGIHSLDINWNAGKVTVSKHDQDTVTVTESCKTELKDSQKVHTWLDGETLRIQYSKSGEAFIGFRNLDKELEIMIPSDMELSELCYDGSSGDLILNEITAGNINADVSSGDVRLLDCSADSIDVDSSSGDIIIEQKGESSSIEADASSGDIDITAEKVTEIEAEASSGSIDISVQEAKSVDTETSSGKTTVRFANMPSSADIETSSGDVKIYVPANADFTADVDTSSGDFDSDIALVRDGSSYISGNGSNRLSVDTSSGDVKILSE